LAEACVVPTVLYSRVLKAMGIRAIEWLPIVIVFNVLNMHSVWEVYPDAGY